MPEPSKIIAELIFKVNLQNLRIQAQYAKKNKNNQFYGIYFSFFLKTFLLLHNAIWNFVYRGQFLEMKV